MTPRIDPDLPFVWRSPDTLQLGAPDALAVIEHPTPAELDLLRLLQRGASVAALRSIAAALDVSAARLDELLAGIAPALVPEALTITARPQPVDTPPRTTRVLVAGEGRLATLVRRALESLGHDVTAVVAAVGDPLVRSVDETVAADADALDSDSDSDGAGSGSGVEGSSGSDGADDRTPAAGSSDTRPDAVVLVAERVIRPADHLPLLRRDIPHLALVRHGATTTVGPFVLPGETACLRCLDLARRDADEAWPLLATQLAAAPAPDGHARADFDAAALAAATVDDLLRHGRARFAGASVEISGLGDPPRRHRHDPHPECGCRAPEGTATAPDLHADRRSVAPSSVRAVAAPA